MTTTFTPVNIESRRKLDIRPGDTVRVHQKIQEKDKTRIQVFEGLVLSRKHGSEPGATFTVRRNTGGFGVEKIYPLFSPMIDKIEVTKRSKVRRSKLYYIRRKALKQIKKRMKMVFVDITTDNGQDDIKGEGLNMKDTPETQDPEKNNEKAEGENNEEEKSGAEVEEKTGEEKKEEEKEEEKS